MFSSFSQLIIDVSKINEIHQGDIVTLIGEQKEISAETIANKADTIYSCF